MIGNGTNGGVLVTVRIVIVAVLVLVMAMADAVVTMMLVEMSVIAKMMEICGNAVDEHTQTHKHT